MVRRRRPLVRAAMVGGGAYAAGKARQRGQSREADQEQRLESVEQQAAAPQAAAPASEDVVGKLKELAQLKDSGALSEEEFEAAKQKLLAG